MSMDEAVMNDAAILVAAVKRAAVLLGIEEDVGEEVWGVLTRAGIDAALASVGHRWFGTEVCFMREQRTSFRLSTSVEMRLTARREDGAVVDVRVSWASGGGEVSHGLAVLEHHMTWLRKAATAEEILRDAVSACSAARRGGSEHFRAVMNAASVIAEKATNDAREAVSAYRAAKKVSA